jgi:hypothetical protein
MRPWPDDQPVTDLISAIPTALYSAVAAARAPLRWACSITIRADRPRQPIYVQYWQDADWALAPAWREMLGGVSGKCRQITLPGS